MSTGSYNEKRGRGQRHFGGWFGVMVVVGVLLTFTGQSVYAQEAPPAGTVTFNSIEAGGTGCLPGTIFTPEISKDQLTLTLPYSDYTAEDGTDIPVLNAEKACNIALNIAYPSGFKFAISAVKFKGFAHLLDAGTVGTLSAQYSFQGQSPQIEFFLQGTGPRSDNYVTSELTPTSGPVMFGRCGGSEVLNINTQVRVEGTGTLKADTTTGLFEQIYTLDWLPC